jgi:predicted nuclease with TOPRIM domain
MSDIVERLRLASLNHDEMRWGWLAEGIDEIERLRERVSELEPEIERLRAELTRLKKVAERLAQHDVESDHREGIGNCVELISLLDCLATLEMQDARHARPPDRPCPDCGGWYSHTDICASSDMTFGEW